MDVWTLITVTKLSRAHYTYLSLYDAVSIDSEMLLHTQISYYLITDLNTFCIFFFYSLFEAKSIHYIEDGGKVVRSLWSIFVFINLQTYICRIQGMED